MRGRIGCASVMLLGFFVVPSEVQAASFDCAKASTSIEKMICGDAELSKLDEDMNAAYKTALQDKEQADTIKQAQKQWMKMRNNCNYATCMKITYMARLKELTESMQNADFNEYIPFETRYTKYNPTLCDKFLKLNNAFRIIEPSKNEAKDLLKNCPDILNLNEIALDDYGLHQADIDNDGINDTVLYAYYRYSNMDPGLLFSINSKTCKKTPVFESYGAKRLLILNGKTFIESTEYCLGATSLPDEDRYIQCRLLYQKTTHNELVADQDAACVFIEKDWLKLNGVKK